MPGGKSNIKPEDGKLYSTEYQPKNRRKSTKLLTDLLTKQLKAKEEILIEGIDVETGKKVTIKVTKPSKETIIHALLKQASKGNINAIKEIFDRIEGKPLQANTLDIDFERLSDADIDFIVEKVLNNSNNYK